MTGGLFSGVLREPANPSRARRRLPRGFDSGAGLRSGMRRDYRFCRERGAMTNTPGPRFCWSCGAAANPGQFCSGCGANLIEPRSAAPGPEPSLNPDPVVSPDHQIQDARLTIESSEVSDAGVRPTRTARRRTSFLLVGVLVAVLFLGGAFVAVRSSQNGQAPASNAPTPAPASSAVYSYQMADTTACSESAILSEHWGSTLVSAAGGGGSDLSITGALLKIELSTIAIDAARSGPVAKQVLALSPLTDQFVNNYLPPDTASALISSLNEIEKACSSANVPGSWFLPTPTDSANVRYYELLKSQGLSVSANDAAVLGARVCGVLNGQDMQYANIFLNTQKQSRRFTDKEGAVVIVGAIRVLCPDREAPFKAYLNAG